MSSATPVSSAAPVVLTQVFDYRSEVVKVDSILSDTTVRRKLFRQGYFSPIWSATSASQAFYCAGGRGGDRKRRDASQQQRIHAEYIESYPEPKNQGNDGWEDEFSVEHRLADPNGAHHSVQTHAAVLDRRSDGSIGRIIATDRDISTRKAAGTSVYTRYRAGNRRSQITGSLRDAGTHVGAGIELPDSLMVSLKRFKEYREAC